ncbi:MAG: lysylphosphatidylglycerol synthase transmembrane domain-containing protein [Acidobacteriota bacterium]
MTTDSTTGGRRARVVVTLLLLAAGVGLLVYMAGQLKLGLADVRDGFGRIGVWFVAIFALSFGRFALRSYAWMALTPIRIPFGAAIAATISGDALGNITPLGLAASEPAKALYLRKYGPPSQLLASLTAENFFYSVSVAIYIIVGAASMLEFFTIEPAIRIAGMVAVAGMSAILLGASWLAWQKPTMASALIARVPIRRVQSMVGQVRAFEEHAYGAAGHQGSRLAIVAACEIAFHLLSFVECWMTFRLLTGVSAFLPVLVLDAFSRVVNIVFKVIPFRAGVEESGTALLAEAIGYAREGGFMLGLVRKARVIVWAGVGMVLWARNAGASRGGSEGDGPWKSVPRT